MTALTSGMLAGCSNSFDPMLGANPSETKIGSLGGSVFGGRTGVAGASVYLYAAGVTGYGSASTSLLGLYVTGNYPTFLDGNGNYYVKTDANGGFKITGEYTCTAGTQVYIYAVGGNPGAGVNSAAGFLAVLGQCPASGSLATQSPYVNVNEASTIAAAYALAGYATDAVHIGGPALTDTLGQTGIANAFLTAGNLFPIGSAPPTGSFPAATTNGYGTLPTARLNALANSVAACVDSTGLGSAQCSTLLGAALSGGTTGTTPTDTASAAINIARHPTANVSAIYGVAPGTGNPYNATTPLTAAPADWTMGVFYSGNGVIAETYVYEPQQLAIDASGNVWNVNYATTGTVSAFTNLGAPVTNSPFTVGAGAYELAIDTTGNVWTANLSGNNLSEISGGTVSTVSPGNLSEPAAIAFDGSGNIFVASAGANELVKLTSAGVYTGETTAKLENMSFPNGLAVEPGPAGSVWAVGQGTYYAGYISNTLTGISSFKFSSKYDLLSAVAIDGSGNAWVGAGPQQSVAGVLEKITTANVGTAYTPGSHQYYIPDYESVAVDGGGNIWSTDSDNGSVYEISSAGATLSGTYGFVPAGNTLNGTSTSVIAVNPNTVAIDESGNVWYDFYSSTATPGIYELIGAGAPTIEPISATVQNSTIGQEP